MTIAKTIIERGSWGVDVAWELYSSTSLPDEKLCTAVFCIAITPEEKIVLMRAKRGWGMLGGHIEANESLADALNREALEEGGFTPSNPAPFAYRKITAKKPILHQDGLTTYPFPISYIFYYWATTIKPIVQHTGTEVLESKSFTVDEIAAMKISDLSTIELGWQSYLKGTKRIETSK